MVVTAEEISRMSRKDFVAPTVEDVCSCGCGDVIEEHSDERLYVGGRQVTFKCYDRIFSARVDKRSIETPRYAT